MVIALKNSSRHYGAGRWLSDFHLIRDGKDRWMIHSPTQGLFEIDEAAAEGLLSLMSGRQDALAGFRKKRGGPIAGEVIGELKTIADLPPSQAGITKRKIRVLSLNVAQVCNLRCRYCYSGDGTYGSKTPFMREETALDLLKRKIRGSRPKEVFNIHFFGGEPLMNFELMRKVVGWADRERKRKNIDFKYSVVTNGTLFEKRIVRFLKDKGFGVTVSIDGDRRTHDLNRRGADGSATHGRVLEGLRLIRSMGGIKGLCARVTVADGRADFVKMFRYLLGLGFKKVHFTPVSGKEGPDWKVMEEGLGRLYRVFRRSYPKRRDWLKVGNFAYLAERLSSGKRSIYPCGAGVSFHAADSDGTIWMCHRFVGDKRFKIGKGKKGNIPKGVDGRDFCRRCWARYLCGGGCHYDNLKATGSISEPDPAYCRYIKGLICNTVMLYISCRSQGSRKKEPRSRPYV